eukprot:6461247-Pyramimonas_sp.AAC.1
MATCTTSPFASLTSFRFRSRCSSRRTRVPKRSGRIPRMQPSVSGLIDASAWRHVRWHQGRGNACGLYE